jgi:hypothetical protein
MKAKLCACLYVRKLTIWSDTREKKVHKKVKIEEKNL